MKNQPPQRRPRHGWHIWIVQAQPRSIDPIDGEQRLFSIATNLETGELGFLAKASVLYDKTVTMLDDPLDKDLFFRA